MTYDTHLLRSFRSTIGDHIHHARRRRKMPLGKLARLSGVPETKIDHYELGKNEIMLHHLLRIACALQIEIVDLIGKGEKQACHEQNT